MSAKAKIGIPYFSTRFLCNGTFGVCPFCKILVELIVRKDFESHTGIEMERHYRAEHPDVL